MSTDNDDYITHAREWWGEAKQEHPVAEVPPVTGQATDDAGDEYATSWGRDAQ